MYKNKYFKYKLKYQNLKDMVAKNLEKFSERDEIKINLLKKESQEYFNVELCNGIIQFTKICIKLFEDYNPNTTTYIFLGQSPIILNIISEVILQYFNKEVKFNYRGLPISEAGGDEFPSTEKELENVFEYFNEFNLNTIEGNCIIIDYVESGQSLAKIAKLVSEYFETKVIPASLLEAVGISSDEREIVSEYYPITTFYIPGDSLEERSGINLLAKKSVLLDKIRLYRKKELMDIMKGNIEQNEAPEIQSWLNKNLNYIILTVISFLKNDSIICDRIPKMEPKPEVIKISPQVLRMLEKKK